MLWYHIFEIGIFLLHVSPIKTGSYVTVLHVSNVVNLEIVLRSNENVVSVHKCALDCKTIDGKSFYYDGAGFVCHCNTQKDHGIQVVSSSSVIYGYFAASGTYRVSINGSSTDCQGLYNQGHRTDGTYTFTPGGDSVECSFSTLQWIIFQRRLDGSVDFNRNWIDYVNGFGDPNGEFWLGLENIHNATKDGCELHIYLEAEPVSVQANGYARYTNFTVGAETTNYSLFADGFSGNVGNNLESHYSYGVGFSTPDVDNDLNNNQNCAQKYSSGWWFVGCLNVNLNGLYLGGANTLRRPLGIIWYEPWGKKYSLLRTEMAYQCN